MDDFKKLACELYKLVLDEHAIFSAAVLLQSDDAQFKFMDASNKTCEFLLKHGGEFRKACFEVKANEELNSEV